MEPSVGPSDMIVHATEDDDTISATVTIDILTSTQDSLQTPTAEDADQDSELWCYCQRNMQEELVGCDKPNCKIQWYHLSCLQLTLNHSYQRANNIVQNVTKSDTSQSARERARQVRRSVRVFKH